MNCIVERDHYLWSNVDQKFRAKERDLMEIAILGWGSLIWDLCDLPISGEWQRGGPVLPIEFSRISTRGERAGCLTLVIDEQNGVNVPTRFAPSPRTNLDDAIAGLRIREGTASDRIGYCWRLRRKRREHWHS